jgi:hypothetical protein
MLFAVCSDEVGPKNTQMNPNINAPPITPKNQQEWQVPWLLSQGLKKSYVTV